MLFEQYKDFVRTNMDVFDFYSNTSLEHESQEEMAKGQIKSMGGSTQKKTEQASSPSVRNILDQIDIFSDVRQDDAGDFFMERHNCGDSMYSVPLNELDEEIKAQIYNPTDPDCQSAHE